MDPLREKICESLYIIRWQCVNMKLKKHNKNNELVLALILFLIIFNPPLIHRFSFTIMTVEAAGLLCLVKYKYISRNILCSNFYKMICILLLYFIYVSAMGALNSVISSQGKLVIVNIFREIILYIAIMAVAVFISYITLRGSYSFEGLLKAYVYCGVMQSILSISSYFIPKIRNFLNAVMVANVRYENIARLTYNSNGLRCYGFASTLFDTFGCAMSLMAIIALYLAIAGKKIFYLYFGMISLSAFMNTRTSLVLITIGFFLVLFLNIKNQMTLKKFIQLTGLGISIFIISIIALRYINRYSTSLTSEWIKSGIESIKMLLLDRKIDRTWRGANTSYFGILFDKFLFLPDDFFSVLFGTGLSPINAAGRGSDVAYVQHVWKYGIVGAGIQYFMYIYAIRQGDWELEKKYKGMISCLGIMIFIFLIKSEGLSYGMPGLILLPLIFSVWSFKRKRKRKILPKP